ncbi:pyridoxamine 5'-phosphate oxidase family protein [Streptomyces sp. CBMA29]|uniref:pyridoxamine 5'-phosphate oxidase family protein n=1 Tax=Streptomyces sp. CBMA29 TaxID=1896314 RepID=UPI001661DEE3|nr:pyridoxamine 5'-phosphate oxidase family protein [Streptomyces sp. CBMA29]MBD0738447.1 pyridoxamine 5'-phosphate oxidase [Streptomyces sp. CBMA29]
MTDLEPTETANLDSGGYGTDTFPWSRAREQLIAGLGVDDDKGPALSYFLGTVSPGGRPHSAGIGALWDDGDMYFTSGPGTRKSRDLAANALCTLSVRLDDLDLVLDGHADRVTDAPTLDRLADRYRDQGWPAEVDGAAFTAPYSAPSAGPAPWYLYRFSITQGVALSIKGSGGATRWRFRR